MLSIKTSLTDSTCKIMGMSSSVTALVATSAVVSDVTSRHSYRGVKPCLHRGYVEAYSARAASSARATFVAVTGLACAAVSLPTVALPLKAFSEDSPQAISFDY